MKSDPRVRATVFDLGGVVIATRVDEIMRSWSRSAGVTFEHTAAAFADDIHHHPLERGEITIAQYHEHVAETIGRDLTFEDFMAGWHAIFAGLVEGIEPVLAAAARHGRCVALTNTNAAHYHKWRRLYGDAVAVFERIFLSYEMGVRKPEPACYRQVLDYLRLPAAEVAFIDDDRANVAAAEALGMKGVVAVDAAQVGRDLAALGVTPA